MQLSFPTARAYPVTQPYGVNKQVYEKLGFPGHDGVDWGVPEGTPILAVDTGKVTLVSKTGNYGWHIRIEHTWGVTIYCHLSRMDVTNLQQVQRGQPIGLSGSTGNVTGPHLHLTMMIKPFTTDPKLDPWRGTCDPLPYFSSYRNPVGPHISNGGGYMLPALGRWQPAGITILDPNPGFVADVRKTCPTSLILGRIFKEDSEVADHIKRDPIEAAHWIDGLIRAHPAYATGLVNYWQVVNEVCQKPWEDFQRLNTCMDKWIDLAGNDYKCGLFTFSDGQPDTPMNDPGWWRWINPTLIKGAARGHILLVHQYGWPDMYKPDLNWHTMRWPLEVRPYIDRRIKVWVSEWGIDRLKVSRDPGGWIDTDLSAAEYARQLLDLGNVWGRYRSQVVAVSIYLWGKSAPWFGYDIDGEVVNIIADTIGSSRQLPPPIVVTPPTPVDPGVSDIASVALSIGRAKTRLSLFAGGALQKAIVAAKYNVTSDEFDLVIAGKTYIGRWGQPADRDGAPRLFFAEVGKWDKIFTVDG